MEDPKDTLIATYEPFRCCRGKAEYWNNGEIQIDKESVKKLGLKINDKIRVYFLFRIVNTYIIVMKKS